jgi:branched-chain amino acid transport system permease protein
VIASYGLAIVLQNAVLLVYGAQPQLLRSTWADTPVEIGPVFLTAQRIAIPLATLALMIAIGAVLRFTWSGRAVRALAQNSVIAQVCGVDVRRVAALTFAIGAALAGFAGVMMATIYTLNPMSGDMFTLKAFTVVILGGLGSIPGAIVAGLLLGVTESLVAGYLGNGFRDIVGFTLVIAVLVLRPQGLFGTRLERS